MTIKFDLKKIFFIVALLFSGSFFFFADHNYYGWDDTNQYQFTAKRLSQGVRPPLKEIQVNTQGVGSDYSKTIPILTPYFWSKLVKKGEIWNQSLYKIKLLQAFLISACFMLLFKFLGSGFSALLICSAIYLNDFFRECVKGPITEPQSLLLITLSFILPSLNGVWTVFQGLTRSPVMALHLPFLVKRNFRETQRNFILFGLTAFAAMLYFKNLIIGVRVPIRPLASVSENINQLSQTTLDLWFRHLVPSQNETAQRIWALILCGVFLLALYKIMRRDLLLFISILAYVGLLFSVLPQGYRYYLPVILIVTMTLKPEFKPRLPFKLVGFLFLGHLVFQHIEEIRWELQHKTSPAQTQGLLDARDWVQKNNVTNLMMFKMRYCLNFFDVQCFSYPEIINAENLMKEIQTHNVSYIVFSGTDWMKEEKVMEALLAHMKSKKTPDEKPIRRFEQVTLFDVRALN